MTRRTAVEGRTHHGQPEPPYVVGSYGPVEITAGRRRWFRRRYLANCALCRNGYIVRSSAAAWDIARDHTCAGRAADAPECQGADFSKLLDHLGANLEAHADRDGLTGVRRGIFLSRGGHAPGEACPTAPPPEPQHHYECEWPDDECTCHRYGVRHG